jgi:hypothetical protein
VGSEPFKSCGTLVLPQRLPGRPIINENHLLTLHRNLLKMLGNQVHILLNYFLLQICSFVIPIKCSLKIAILFNLSGKYFFITQGHTIQQHWRHAARNALDCMISL